MIKHDGPKDDKDKPSTEMQLGIDNESNNNNNIITSDESAAIGNAGKIAEINVFTKDTTKLLITEGYRPGLCRLKAMAAESDLTLIVGPNPNKETYHVHRQVLTRYSSYFDQKIPLPFYGKLDEHSFLHCPELDVDVLPDVLEFFYAEKFPKTRDIRQTARIFVMAHTLQAWTLSQLAAADFCRYLADPNFCVRPAGQTDEINFGTVHEGVYYDEIRWLRHAFKMMLEVYDKKEMNTYWKLLAALNIRNLLGLILASRDMRKFLSERPPVGLAILDFYVRQDTPAPIFLEPMPKAKL